MMMSSSNGPGRVRTGVSYWRLGVRVEGVITNPLSYRGQYNYLTQFIWEALVHSVSLLALPPLVVWLERP